ncbi:hypothetical protein [Microbacterium sp.]|uniref:hypothetical protein n=1 Tax=Microbacterium sp. TaxID=51671 RepID=UPI0039E4E96E
MTDEHRAARARRRTWVTGGVLVVLTALVGVFARFDLARFHFLKDVLWALAVTVLVIGLGRAGSITARRPIASIVVLLQVAVASPLLPAFLSGLAPRDTGNLYEEEDAYMALMMPYFFAVFALTVAAVILIGIIGALPHGCSWAPAVVTAASALASAAAVAVVPLTDEAGPVRRVLFEVPGAGMLLLGVLAIVLGVRAERAERATPVVTERGGAEVSISS